IIEIIEKIHKQKQEQNKVPDFALKKEIWKELFLQMELELELLCQDGKVTRGQSINYEYFEIK
ncbi:MAG: hypothetical protein P1P88_23740, partial [Bacteroidales bacterium]|nr:hypothetical protein [Bacteroidales bacterium]